MGVGLLGAAMVLWTWLSLRSAWHRVEPLGQIIGQTRHDTTGDRAGQVAKSYLPLGPHLRGMAEVGFVTHAQDPDRDMLRYYMAQSMLTPTLVIPSTDRPVVIASFDDDPQLDAFLQTNPFSARQRFGNGLAILDRKGP